MTNSVTDTDISYGIAAGGEALATSVASGLEGVLVRSAAYIQVFSSPLTIVLGQTA